MNRINLNDEPEVIYEKIMRAKTDSIQKVFKINILIVNKMLFFQYFYLIMFLLCLIMLIFKKLQIRYDPNRPELANLLRIFACFSDKTPEEIAKVYQDKSMKDFKEALAQEISSKYVFPLFFCEVFSIKNLSNLIKSSEFLLFLSNFLEFCIKG